MHDMERNKVYGGGIIYLRVPLVTSIKDQSKGVKRKITLKNFPLTSFVSGTNFIDVCYFSL